jgi:hypothetical protein
MATKTTTDPYRIARLRARLGTHTTRRRSAAILSSSFRSYVRTNAQASVRSHRTLSRRTYGVDLISLTGCTRLR